MPLGLEINNLFNNIRKCNELKNKDFIQQKFVSLINNFIKSCKSKLRNEMELEYAI